MPAEGGPARRLTWLGTDTLVRGWTPAGEIVYVTTQGQPFFRNHHAFVVDAAGGTPRPLPWGQVNHLAFGPGERRRDRPQHRRPGALEALSRRHRRRAVDRRRGQRQLPAA